MGNSLQHQVVVIGAGPAGLYAGRELAINGAGVALINRDIKPGGLAEYGIYPDKLKMKVGLRSQFRQVIAQDAISYYGNVTVVLHDDLRLDEFRDMGFQAILVTVGAQGTKWLGLPGGRAPDRRLPCQEPDLPLQPFAALQRGRLCDWLQGSRGRRRQCDGRRGALPDLRSQSR